MNNFECKKVENCFAGDMVFEYRVNFKIDDDFLAAIDQVTTMKVCRKFPRPFFTADWPDGTKAKGVLGDVAVKVIYPPDSADSSKVKFETFLSKYLEQRAGRLDVDGL